MAAFAAEREVDVGGSWREIVKWVCGGGGGRGILSNSWWGL